MPNKDSFTFSDKLRKSKSVPLSKRLPSIVGGQNKQKRTLVQRAQRDLPFILVAACALLLLPFLSKNGSDDIAAPGDFGWAASQEEPAYADGGGADIMPAGAMTDPLDMILRPRSAVEEPALNPEGQKQDAYGDSYRRRYDSDRDRDSSYKSPYRSQYDDRKDYDKQYSDRAAKPTTVEKFGKKTRPAVRNSIVRKGTEINRALRVSQMPSGKGATGVSHALPLGQGPANVSSPAAPNPGVRPIALQPMEARGTVGRSMTGENLYAEAARSINAMNAGRGAKANLLAAQMKDVDGALTTPGEGGAFGGAGSPRPGAGGGGPNNNNGYNVAKPWWWDMMQARSQKWWELFQYKWREMLWTNIYDIIFNGGKQIVNCLLFGSKDVDVSHMFGASSGSPDYVCVKDGKEIPEVGSAKDFAGDFSNKTQSGTKDGNSEERTDTGSSWESYVRFCASYGGKPAKSENADDGFFKVRSKCLGLNILAKEIRKWAAAKEYKGNCSGVNKDPLDFTYTVTKNGKEKERLEQKTVIALVAKVKNAKYANKEGSAGRSVTGQKEFYNTPILSGKEIVVYAQMGNHITKTDEELDELIGDNCELTKLVALVPSDMTKNEVQRSIDAKNEKEPSDGTWYYKGQIEAAQRMCKGQNTNVTPLEANNVSKLIGTIGGSQYTFDAKKGSYLECTIYSKNDRPKVGETRIDGTICYPESASTQVDMQQRQEYSAIITNPEPDKLKVYAILVEDLAGQKMAQVVDIVQMNENNRDPEPLSGTKHTYRYHFYTASNGVFGYNTALDGKTVRTDIPGESGDQNSSSTSNSDTATAAAHAEREAINSTLREECVNTRNKCYGAHPDGTIRNGDGSVYTTCDQEFNKCIGGMTAGTYQANTTSNSSGQNNENKSARGTGRVFWILSESNLNEIKVKFYESLGGPLGIVKDAGIFFESVVASGYCDYYWCNRYGSCDAPQHNDTGNRCKDVAGKVYNSHYWYGRGVDKPLHIKLNELPNAQVDITHMPFCDDICYDAEADVTGDAYPVILDPNNTKTELGKLNEMSGLNKDIIPQCPVYCQHNNKAYPCEIVPGPFTIGALTDVPFLYVRTSTTPANISLNGLKPCNPIAWYEKAPSDFTIYVMPPFSGEISLPLRKKDDNNATRSDGNDIGIFMLNRTINDQPFKKLKKGITGDPTMYELFPKITEPVTEEIAQAESAVADTCTGILYATYKNASIVPKNKEEFDTLIRQMNECVQHMTEYDNAVKASQPGKRVQKKIYIYGYASTQGNGKQNCDGHGQSGYTCNYALSEDRVLYMANRIVGNNTETFKVDTSVKNATGNGFTNTNARTERGVEPGVSIDPETHRYNFTAPSGDGFTIVSIPCGSDGGDIQPSSRYIAISLTGPADDDPDEHCRERWTKETLQEKGMQICTESDPAAAMSNSNSATTTIQPIVLEGGETCMRLTGGRTNVIGAPTPVGYEGLSVDQNAAQQAYQHAQRFLAQSRVSEANEQTLSAARSIINEMDQVLNEQTDPSDITQFTFQSIIEGKKDRLVTLLPTADNDSTSSNGAMGPKFY